ncbi:MAG TPA: hypothetical protein VMG37_12090 [Solirubrobacteraceae bacterium]|nr:hypothetical protein [Solirubrobacteraceae bacterium]
MRVPRVKRAEGRRWISRLLVGLALIVAVAVVIVVVENAGSSTPSASGNASKPSGSTTVQRRNLVETDTESGTLSYNSPQTVYNRMSGTITWLPQVGQVIKPGATLYKVDGQPVLLMDGATPAYRDLGPSDSDGADVEELNRNLVKLGFNAANITVDDVWQAATTEGVDLLQESLGETETGTLTLGRIVFLPGDQLVTTVDGTLGSTGGTNASATVTPSPEFVDYSVPETSSTTPSAHRAAKARKPAKCPSTTSTTSTTPSTSGTQSSKCKPKNSGKPTSEQQLQALLALLKAETKQLKSSHGGSPGSGSPSSGSGSPSGSHSGSGNSGSGSSGSGNNGAGNSGSGDNGAGSNGSGNSGSGNATAILQTTSTQLVVTVDLAATVQSEAVEGEHVTVEMPNGDVVNGRITAVSPVAQSSSSGDNGNGNGGNGNGNGNNGNNGNGSNGNGSSSTIPVTITLTGHNTGAGLDQAAVSVNFVQQKATNVLSVPVTALLATGGGNYSVQEAAAPHTLIPVTTGLFAAGYVEIAGSGIYPGLAVTDSQG